VWPLGHLAVGYLLYSALSRRERGYPPDGTETIVVVFGTQFPDLVDKPLAWTFGLLPNGRSLTHSLLIATALVTVFWIVTRRVGAPSLGTAFGIGYLSHILGDLIPALLYGMPGEWKFLFWPVLPPVDYGPSAGFEARITTLELTPLFALQVVMGLFTLAVWIRDGMPALPGDQLRG